MELKREDRLGKTTVKGREGGPVRLSHFLEEQWDPEKQTNEDEGSPKGREKAGMVG